MLSCGQFVKSALVLLTFLATGLVPSHAADLETQVVDKNCWIEIFEDDEFDADDPHVKLYGPKEFATLKNVAGKDWSNDVESVIVGSNATVRAYEDKDFKGTEIAFAPGQRAQNLGKVDMANDIESMKIACGK
jgi:Beta/Gamma crystallin